jgi:hypothetical protein
VIRGAALSAKVIWLCDRRAEVLAIDLRTVVDVAIRDLDEIQHQWGTELARFRLMECQDMLRRAFVKS